MCVVLSNPTPRSRGGDFQEYAISSSLTFPCIVCVHVCVPYLHAEWIKQYPGLTLEKPGMSQFLSLCVSSINDNLSSLVFYLLLSYMQ